MDCGWLMGHTAIGLGWRFVDGLFVGLARFWVWIGAVVAVSCDYGCWWWFLAIFCVCNSISDGVRLIKKREKVMG